MQGGEITDVPDEVFSVDSGMIKVTQGPGRKQGYLGTDRKYSHYRARMEYRFAGTEGNAGLLYHVDGTVPPQPQTWPRSIECQLMQGDAGRGHSNAMAIFSTLAIADRYHPEGTLVDVCERTSGGICDAREYGASAILDKPGQWNRLEVVVRGSDSAQHRINDSTVFRLWNIRVPAGPDTSLFALHGSGSLALLAEGASLTFRNWEIMELPPDGPSTLQRLFLTNTNGGAHLSPGGTHTITWNTLGEVNKVSLFWHGGDGNWEMLADQITNTGSFEWTVPSMPTSTLRVKVTAAPWVLADSSAADNAIGPGAGLVRRPAAAGKTQVGFRGRDAKGRLTGEGARPGRRRGL